MRTIEVMNLIIALDLFEEERFISTIKYLTNKKPEYFIISKRFSEFEFTFYEPNVRTEFYDLYYMDGKKIQIQKVENEITGAIVYDKNTIYIYPRCITFELEYLLSQYAFLYILSLNDALILHGSSFIYNNKGIILSAKSGTGKSTHSRLWQKYENVSVINDDKNILRIENDKLYMYGSPWSGKHMLDNNLKSEVSAICFLYQNKENEIKRLPLVEAMKKLMGQLVLPNKDNKDLWSNIMDKLLSLPIYHLGCNMEKEAYLTLKERLDLDLCQ